MITGLAIAGICGLPVDRIIDADELEGRLWARVIERADVLRAAMMKAEASHVAAAIARSFRRG